jgi:hypothetical protein
MISKISATAIALAATGLACGCATQMTAEGAQVRQITPAETQYCRFVSLVEGANYLGNTMDHDRAGALNEVRNKVAALGGNAFVIAGGGSAPIGTFVQAEAYACPDSRVPVSAPERKPGETTT